MLYVSSLGAKSRDYTRPSHGKEYQDVLLHTIDFLGSSLLEASWNFVSVCFSFLVDSRMFKCMLDDQIESSTISEYLREDFLHHEKILIIVPWGGVTYALHDDCRRFTLVSSTTVPVTISGWTEMESIRSQGYTIMVLSTKGFIAIIRI